MVIIGAIGKGLGRNGRYDILLVWEKIAVGRQDTRNLARILCIIDRCTGENPEIRIEIVFGFGTVLEIKAVTDRLEANIAL